MKKRSRGWESGSRLEFYRFLNNCSRFIDPEAHDEEGDEADGGAGNEEGVIVEACQGGSDQGGEAAGDAGGGAGEADVGRPFLRGAEFKDNEDAGDNDCSELQA